jgi:hypothetical protein
MVRSVRLSFLLGLAFFTSLGCDREKPAQDVFVTTTPWASYNGYGDEPEFRAESPGSPVLLFRRRRSPGVYRYDPSAGAIVEADTSTWERATGKVMEGFASMTGSIGTSEKRVPLRGSTFEPYGEHFFGLAYSSELERAAILSANGRYHPQTSGLMFGGRNRYATGQHFHQIIEIDSMTPVGKALPLPLSSKHDGSINIAWSSDDQYVLYFATKTHKVAIVQTGLKPRSLHRDLQNRIAVFRPHAWTHALDDTVLLRYDTDRRESFLLKLKGESAIYRFDEKSFELTRVEDRAWERAAGLVYDASKLHEQPTRFEMDYSGDSARLRFGEARWVPTKGANVSSFARSPRADLIATVSTDLKGGGGDTFLGELWRVPELERAAGPFALDGQATTNWSADQNYLLFTDVASCSEFWLLPVGNSDVIHFRIDESRPGRRLRCPLARYRTKDAGQSMLIAVGENHDVFEIDLMKKRAQRRSREDWNRAAGSAVAFVEWTHRSRILRTVRPGKLKRGRVPVATAGEKVIALSVGPNLETVVVLSRAKPAKVYQELFRLPEATRIGPAVELPWLWGAPFIAWSPDERFILYSDSTQRLGIVDVQNARTAHPGAKPAASPAKLVEPTDHNQLSFDLKESCDSAKPEKNRCPDEQGRCFRCRDTGSGYYRLRTDPAPSLANAVQRHKSDQALDYTDCGDLSLQGADRLRVNDCFVRAFRTCRPAEIRASRTGKEARETPFVMLAEPRDGKCVVVYFFEHEGAGANTNGLLRNECQQLDAEMTPTDCRIVEVWSGRPRSESRRGGGTGRRPR